MITDPSHQSILADSNLADSNTERAAVEASTYVALARYRIYYSSRSFALPASNNEKIPTLLAPIRRCATVEPRGDGGGGGPAADADANCRE